MSRQDSSQQHPFDLEERTSRFGEALISLAKKLPLSEVMKPLIPQLVRAGTSVGANYVEADDSVSKKDFRYNISRCKKEARETKYWLRMIVAADDTHRDELRVLWREAKELHLIFAAIWRDRKEKKPPSSDESIRAK